MEHRRKIYILLCGVIVALLFVACSKSGDEQGDDELTWYEQIYFNITRASVVEGVAEDTTYNFTLFGGTDGNTYYSGTYRLPTSDEITSILYPCRVVSSTGAIYGDGAFDSSYGLYASAGNYQIVVASPAVAVSSVTDHTDSERKGFKINRYIDDSSSNEVDLYIKGPRDVSVSGVEIGGEKEYLSSAAELCSPRSKFVLYIRCEDDEQTETETETETETDTETEPEPEPEPEPKCYYVYDVYFDNILNTGYYNPTVGYYRGANDVVTITPYSTYVQNNTPIIATSTPKTMEVDDSEKTTIEDSDENVSIDDAFYLIANDCSGGESTYVAVPRLVIKLNRNANEDNIDEASVVTIPLEYNFQRSYYYEFTITISPVGITLTGIAVAEWTEVSGGDITVENLSSIVFDWDDVGNWEEGDGGTANFN